MHKIFLSIVLVLYLLIAPYATFAQQKGSIELSPAYTEISLKDPLQEKSFVIEFKNNSDKNISLDISALDFQQQGERGEISFLGKDSKGYSYSLSSFLSFESNRLDIDAGDKRNLEVTVKNRPDLSPGGHYAAVIARLSSEQVENQNSTIFPAISSLIFMKKEGGERFNLSIQEVDFPASPLVFRVPKSIDMVFQNGGNIHLVPYGRYEVKDIFGRLIYKGVLNTSSAIVFPESRRIVSTEVKKVAWEFPISINQITIKGTDSLRKTQYSHSDSYIYFNPGILLLIFILITFLIAKRLRKRRNEKHK